MYQELWVIIEHRMCGKIADATEHTCRPRPGIPRLLSAWIMKAGYMEFVLPLVDEAVDLMSEMSSEMDSESMLEMSNIMGGHQ